MKNALQIQSRLQWESQALRDFIDAPKNSRPHRKALLDAAKSRREKILRLAREVKSLRRSRRMLRNMPKDEHPAQKKLIRKISAEASKLRKEVAV